MQRRDFFRRAAGGGGALLAFHLGGAAVLLSPREARAREIPLRHLEAADAHLLEWLAERIAPGAAEAGTAHFIDQQLGVEPNDCLLMAKFFELSPPYGDFYHAGCEAVRGYVRREFGGEVFALDEGRQGRVLAHIATPERVDEAGFPLFLFYLCLRSDAVDMVYGTPEGFEALGIPYMAHIPPPSLPLRDEEMNRPGETRRR